MSTLILGIVVSMFGINSWADNIGTNNPDKMVVAVTASFPPIVSVTKDGEYIGLDADIIIAVARELNVELEWVNIKFDGIIPGIAAGRFDVGMTGITDTVERQQAVDFVNYANVGSGIIVRAGNPKNIQSISDLCGVTVASQTGDVATMYAKQQSKKCVEEGRPAVVLNEYPEGSQGMLQLRAGRADVVIHDYPLSAYMVQNSDGALSLVTEQFNQAPYGMAIAKNNVALRTSLINGLNAIIKSGEYREILKKYDVEDIAIEKADFNMASK